MDPSSDGERPDGPWVPVPGMTAEQQAEMVGSIAMSAPSGVVASEPDGRIAWVNPVAGVMFGFRREELLGRPFTTLLPPESHQQVLRIRERILRGEDAAPFLMRGRHRSGRTLTSP